MIPRLGRRVSELRPVGGDGAPGVVMRTQLASCHCGAELRFTTGSYGQMLEVCTSRRCEGRMPHPVRPDPAAPAQKPWVPTTRRRAQGPTSPTE